MPPLNATTLITTEHTPPPHQHPACRAPPSLYSAARTQPNPCCASPSHLFPCGACTSCTACRYSRYLSFHFPFTHERSLLEHLRAVPWRFDQRLFKVGGGRGRCRAGSGTPAALALLL
jgi:hypothetical protein